MRILLVVHGFPPSGQGGSEVYAAAHAAQLRHGHGDDVVVLTREADPERPELAVRHELRDGLRIVWINNLFRDVRSLEESYERPAIAALAADLIAEFQPEVAHIHHLTCLSTRIVHALEAARVPTCMTLHDYWLICHRGQLLDRALQACAGPDGGCANCLEPVVAAPAALRAGAGVFRRVESALPQAVAGRLRVLAGAAAARVTPGGAVATAMGRRLAHMRDVCARVDRFLAPSDHLRHRFIRFGIPPERITLSPYGFAPLALPRRSPHEAGRPLRVGFVGSLMVSKAPHILLEAARTLPEGSVRVELFGGVVPYHGDDSYRERLRPLLAAPNVHMHGPRPHDAMADALAGLDLLVVPSVWPENSPLVIGEAFMAGVVPVAADIGGIPERIRHDHDGLLFPAGDVTALSAALARFLDDPSLLARLRRNRPAVRTIADDVASVRRACWALASQPGRWPARPRVRAVVLNYGTPEQTLITVRTLLASTHPLEAIHVIDNGPDDACGAALRELPDRVEVVATGRNLGFAGGVNEGVARASDAGATHVFLVNSDVTVPPDCLERLLATAAAHPEAGIVGPVVLLRSTPDRVESAGLSFDRSTGRMRMRGFGARREDAAALEGPVAAVSGCAMLVTAGVFARAGGFDERYFFGFEEIDFCLRAAQAGVGTRVSDAVVYHEGGGTLRHGDRRRLHYATRNHLRLAWHAGPDDSTLRRVLRAGAVVAWNAAFAVRSRPLDATGRLIAVARGARDALLGRSGPVR